jgi:hypothetical protein
MMRALDPVSGLMVEPNPGARAECQFCSAPMIAKCGAQVRWYWSHHASESCIFWEEAERTERETPSSPGAPQPPRHLCTSCQLWLDRRCTSSSVEAKEWLEAWGNRDGGEAWFYRGAPQCPGWRWYRPLRHGHDQNPVKSQWRDRCP